MMEEIIIEVVDVIENDNGAEIILNLNEAGQNLLMEEGLISILKSSLGDTDEERMESKNDGN
jgi:hypothetical protein